MEWVQVLKLEGGVSAAHNPQALSMVSSHGI